MQVAGMAQGLAVWVRAVLSWLLHCPSCSLHSACCPSLLLPLLDPHTLLVTFLDASLDGGIAS